MPPTRDTKCARCNHFYADHGLLPRAAAGAPRVGGGICACGGCEAFVPPDPMAKFKLLLKWVRKWSKKSKRRTVERFRPIWQGLGHEITYLTHCRNCKTPTIVNNAQSKHFLRRYEGLQCVGCARCKDCCTCTICDLCNQRRRAGYFCDACRHCVHGCCECQLCHNCRKKCGGDLCRNCGVCNTCCKCSDLGRVPFIKQQPKFHVCNRTDHKSNPTSRFIAAEIEVAEIGGKGKPVYRAVKKWGGSVVYDGSLPGSGFEINTSPASGDLFVQQINEICNELANAEPYVNMKCGLHVHLDARDYNYYDIRRLIKVYASIEEALFSMVPYDRHDSRFCLPCGSKLEKTIATGRLPYEKVKTDIILGTYNDKSTLERRTNKYEKARYNALNIHSWFYRGTIECRMFEGTVNPYDIINWGILWAVILDYVLASSDEDVARNIVDSPRQNLSNIVGKNANLRLFIESRMKSQRG